ncbi:MAG: DUF1990 family protein [Acidimicrobiales bacterium]
MPRRPPLSRRLATATLWPFGIGLTSWHYLWRTTPLHRRQLPGSPEADGGPPMPDGVSVEEVQGAESGVGPLFHRRYRVRIREAPMSPERLVERLGGDLNAAAPTGFARFARVTGDPARLGLGDELVVRMPGPWDGPIRVVETTPRSFRLATLEGHLEAGQIEFRACAAEARDLVFTVESWARSGDRLSHLLFQRLRMAKEVQFHMWTSFLERVVKLSGGRMVRGIDIETRVVDDQAGDSRPAGHPAARRLLDELHARALNFELGDRDRFTAENGWLVDDYRQPLPAEPPGPPVPGGSWEVARQLLRDYEFADPAMVRAVYHPERDLDGRDMVLDARFHGLRFRLGVRVGGVVEEERDAGGRRVRVWGWNYRTLQGHLEMGQMDFEVWKWLDTGEVEFRTNRFSRRAPGGNPIVRLGLRVFGRREQVRFARKACERMAKLTAAGLDAPGAGHGIERVANHLVVRSSGIPG